MNKIKKIVKTNWVQHDGKMGYCYYVYYNKMVRTFTFRDNLPLTVLNFLLESNCKTEYRENGKKTETFVM